MRVEISLRPRVVMTPRCERWHVLSLRFHVWQRLNKCRLLSSNAVQRDVYVQLVPTVYDATRPQYAVTERVRRAHCTYCHVHRTSQSPAAHRSDVQPDASRYLETRNSFIRQIVNHVWFMQHNQLYGTVMILHCILYIISEIISIKWSLIRIQCLYKVPNTS